MALSVFAPFKVRRSRATLLWHPSQKRKVKGLSWENDSTFSFVSFATYVAVKNSKRYYVLSRKHNNDFFCAIKLHTLLSTTQNVIRYSRKVPAILI